MPTILRQKIAQVSSYIFDVVGGGCFMLRSKQAVSKKLITKYEYVDTSLKGTILCISETPAS